MPNDIKYYIGNVAIYHSNYGIILNNKLAKDGWYADKIIAVENKKNIVSLSSSGNYKYHYVEAHNIFVSAFVRTTCLDCYILNKIDVNIYC